MNTHSIVIAIGLTIIAVPMLVDRAAACSCRQGTVESAIAATAIVFDGEIVDIRTADGSMQQVTTVKVLRPIKGDVGGTIEIATHTMSASCGYDFRGQERQLIVGAYPGKSGGLATDLCTMFLLNRR